MSEPEQDPRDLIRRYYPLEGAIAPLVELVKVQPAIAEQVIALAMVMGIHAEARRAADAPVFQAVKDDLQKSLRDWSGFR